MPCTDVRENLDIEIVGNKVVFYAISKKTCGAEVGQQSLLLDWAQTKSCDEIQDMYMDQFLNDYSNFKDSSINKDLQVPQKQFIFLKHFEMLQQAVNTLLLESENSLFQNKNQIQVHIDFLEYNNKAITARLLFEMDYQADENPGCGTGCSKGGCGK